MTNLELYKDTFFLHSFLDEYIASGKGNDVKKTIDSFIKYAPEPYSTNFKNAQRFYSNDYRNEPCILDYVNKIKLAKVVDYKKVLQNNVDAFKYNISNDTETEKTSYRRTYVNGRRFLVTPKGSKFPNGFAGELKNDIYFIDIETETIIENAIDNIIDKAITASATESVFFPIITEHLIGLLITKDYVVITNSGDGLQYHCSYDKSRNESDMKKDTNRGGGNREPNVSDIKMEEDMSYFFQCVLYFVRPCDNILKKILKEFIQITNHLYNNIDVKSVYARIYKLYFLHIMKINEIDVTALVSEILRNKITYNPSMHKLNEETSDVLKPAWIHPSYHEEVVYRINIDYNKINHNLLNIFTQKALDSFYETVTDNHEISFLPRTILKHLETVDDFYGNLDLYICDSTILQNAKNDQKSVTDVIPTTIMTTWDTCISDIMKSYILCNFSHYKKTSNDESTENIELNLAVNMELICDILLHETKYTNNNCIVVKKNNQMFPESYDKISKYSKDHLAHILIKYISVTPNFTPLYNKIRGMKIDLDSDGLYMREQYAGSCTFNGILLAICLLDSDTSANDSFDVINNTPGKPYKEKYKLVKVNIQTTQIKEYTKKLNNYYLDEKDRLIIEALSHLFASEKYYNISNNDIVRDFIVKAKEKLSKQMISSISATQSATQSATPSATPSDLSNKNIPILDKYAGIKNTIDTAAKVSDIVIMWDDVIHIINDKKYNDPCFTKFIMNPYITWILNNISDISKNWNALYDKISKVVHICHTNGKKQNDSMMALYMTILYTIFKIMEIIKLFDAEKVKYCSISYKKSNGDDETQSLFQMFYVTSIIDSSVLSDLCKVLDKYQFLILYQDNILDFINHSKLINQSEIGLIGYIDYYKTLQKWTDILYISTVGCNIDIGSSMRAIEIKQIITMTGSPKISQADSKKQDDNIKRTINGNTYIELRFEYTEGYLCMYLDDSIKDRHFIVAFANNNIAIIGVPIDGFFALDIEKYLENFKNKPPLIDFQIMFSRPITKNIQIFHIDNRAIDTKDDIDSTDDIDRNDEISIQYNESNIRDFKINCLGRPLHKFKKILDILRVKYLLKKAKYDILKEYLDQFLDNNIYRIPLLHESPDNIGTLPIIPYNETDNDTLSTLPNGTADDNDTLSTLPNGTYYYNKDTPYMFYNLHHIMVFYADEIKKITRKTVIPDPDIDIIIHKLRALCGDIDLPFINHLYPNDIFMRVNVNVNTKFLTLHIKYGESDVTKLEQFNSMENNTCHSLNTDTVLSFYNDSKKKVCYDTKSKEVYINDHLMMNKDKLMTKITDLEKKKKIKNAQMIKNMMYYAEGIPDFVIGLNTADYTSGIIVFCPKNVDYYNKYLYDHPWVDIEKNVSGEDLIKMSVGAPAFTWVKFDINEFNSVTPILGTDNISQDDNDLLSFTLFCEYLLIHGKHELFGLLIPQLASAYHTELKLNSVTLNKHKILIKFILTNNYIISPYRYFYLNKLHLLIYGTYKIDYRTLYKYKQRERYYPLHYQYLNKNNAKDLTKSIDDYTFDLQFYDKWQKKANEIINPKQLESCKVEEPPFSEPSKIKQQSLKDRLSKLIEDTLMEMKEKTEKEKMEHVLDLEHITKYSSMLHYICKKDNFESIAKSLEFTILNNIKNILEKVEDDIEIIGNIKYYIKPAFKHSNNDRDEAKYIKLFELITGKILDNIQYEFVLKMFDDDKNQIYKVYELLMGRGKTSVIIPCIMFCYMLKGSYYNIISCIPIHLVNQSMAILNKLCPFLINGVVCRATCDRDSIECKSLSSLIVSPINKIICIDDSSLKSYHLSCVENSKIMGCGETRKILCDNTLIIMDEFDSLIDPLKSDLNYPREIAKKINQRFILNNMIVCITEKLFNTFPDYMLNGVKYSDRTNKLAIRYVMNSFNRDKCKDIYKQYDTLIKRIRVTNHADTLEQFNELYEYDKKDIINQLQKGGDNDSLLMFYIREVYKTYIMCMIMMLDKDYGWDDTSESNPYIVIPYSAQKTPMKGSTFTDPIIRIILTSIAYFTKPFREIDALELSIYIAQLIKITSEEFVSDDKKLDMDGIRIAMRGNAKDFADYLNKLKKDRKKDDNLSKYNNYIRVYIEYIIFEQYVHVDPNIYNCSFIDMIDPNFIKRKFALSGTIKIHLPEFSYYGKDKKTILEVDGKKKIKNILSDIIGDDITKDEINKVLHSVKETIELDDLPIPKDIRNPEEDLKLEDDINSVICDLDKEIYDDLYRIVELFANYDVLIDVGSFLRNYENKDFALIVSNTYPDYTIIYFDQNDKSVAMKNKKTEKYDMKYLKYDKKTKVIFDQKHTIGTDLDLHSLSRAILTVNLATATRTQVVQGAFRLREAYLNQTITFLTKGFSGSRITSADIVEQINVTESNIFDRSKIKFYQQYILCLLRRYDMYGEASYQYRSFIPSDEMPGDIFYKDQYDYDYKKAHFYQYVQNSIKRVDEMYVKKVDCKEGKIKKKIKDDINHFLKIIKDSTIIDNSIVIQKQSNMQTQQVKVYQTDINKRDISKMTIKIKSEEKVTYGIYLEPSLITHMVKIDEDVDVPDANEHDIVFRRKIMPYYILRTNMIERLKIQITPDSAYSILKTYINGECNDLFYIMFIDPESDSNKPTAILYTSVDELILISQNSNQKENLVPVDKFIPYDASNHHRCYCQHYIMLLLFNIPTEQEITYLEETISIPREREMFGKYYKQAFNYNIRSMSSKFADFIKYDM